MAELRKLRELVESVMGQAPQFCAQLHGGLAEATFDGDKRTVQCTVIRKGWSANGVYYGSKALDQIAEALNTRAKKVFMNHMPAENLFAPRQMQDWVATVVSAEKVIESTGEETVKAVIKVHEDGPHAWVYGRMASAPSEFGPSIVGRAILKQGTAEGKTGKLVEDIVMLRSFDIVAEPAAGGKIDKVFESTLEEPPAPRKFIKEDFQALIQKMKDWEQERELRDTVWEVCSMIQGYVMDCVLGEDEMENVPVADRKAALSETLDGFKTYVMGMTFVEPKEPQETEETKKALEDKDMDIKNKNELRVAYPAIVEELITEARQGTVEKKELDTVNEELTKVKSEKEALEAQVKTLTEEKKTLATKVDGFELKEREAMKAQLIGEAKKEAKLADGDCSELFNKELVETEFKDEKSFKEAVLARCKDRADLIEATRKTAVPKTTVRGLGVLVETKKPAGDGTDAGKAPDAKGLAEGLKG